VDQSAGHRVLAYGQDTQIVGHSFHSCLLLNLSTRPSSEWLFVVNQGSKPRFGCMRICMRLLSVEMCSIFLLSI
jgi:hypothetical protein